MQICFVYKEDYPWDIRVEKIVETLAEYGHEVTLVARNLSRQPTEDRLGAVRIRRLPALPALFGRLNALVSLPLFFNPLWLFAIFQALRSARAPLVIVRDLPLMPSALLVAWILRRRVVFDMAECYPEMYASMRRYRRGRVQGQLLKHPRVAAILERIAVRYTDHILVVVEESRDRLLRMGCAPGKITIVSNTPRVRPPTGGRAHTVNGAVKLVYVGFITRIRGIDNALRGLAAYKAHGEDRPPVEFHVVGKGAALADCRALAKELGLDRLVHFHGWRDHRFVEELYAESDIGVLTYRLCGHWSHTIPNKLFDYMNLGIPVISTNVPPIQRIIEDVGCGVICADNDAASFADCLLRLTSAAVRSDMGQRGSEAVRTRYNWDVDSARLVEVVSRLRPSDGGRADVPPS